MKKNVNKSQDVYNKQAYLSRSKCDRNRSVHILMIKHVFSFCLPQVPTDGGQNPNYAQASSACSHTYTPLERNLPQVPTNSGQNTDYAQASSACSHTYAPLERNLPKAPTDSGPNPEYAQASSAWSDIYASLERNKEGEQQ